MSTNGAVPNWTDRLMGMFDPRLVRSYKRLTFYLLLQEFAQVHLKQCPRFTLISEERGVLPSSTGDSAFLTRLTQQLCLTRIKNSLDLFPRHQRSTFPGPILVRRGPRHKCEKRRCRSRVAADRVKSQLRERLEILELELFGWQSLTFVVDHYTSKQKAVRGW